MDSTILAILVLILGLAIGAGAGWYFGSRPAADLKTRLSEREAEAKELDAKYLRVFADLEAAREKAGRVDSLEEALERVRDENSAFKAERAAFDEKTRILEESRDKLLKEFENTGASVLNKAQEAFLKRADERFKQSEESGQAKIKSLLAPVADSLNRYEKSVKEMESDRKKEYGNISSLIDQVRLGQEAVKLEASNIVNSLRAAPKTSGRWGEQQFENLLDMAGLSKFTDYRAEVSVQSDDGLLRPDYIINLPGGRQLIVDIKCPLDAYLSATDVLDPSEKKKAFESFSDTVKGHANALSKKSYWSQFENAPDFVILYIPGDNFHSAALEHRPTMWEDAARNRVIISGPATFLPLARTIASMWDQEKLTDKAQEIIDLGRELHHNLSLMTERIRKLGSSIDGTAKAYNEFIKSADGKVILGARKLEELNLTKSDKRLGSFDPVDTETRALTRISPPEQSGED
ncbi:DNA recombination protein RmuC [Altererythrobacter lutimaris]|uniref:DNA recombination protein RmuC homolog n=1 Tax=Altererythrobacter lutimaris TaxID=2743979 RepID=A0A850H5Y7_9SPHN|nr:DNA recombination protein RmuC [Altererythrobacter lutimaris]NVE94644.1 DNA recombination protein RmuC [Altererythrobacter lutimaris]